MDQFQPNTEGVFHGLSFEEYKAAPGIGQSMLKKFAAEPTPKHFQESLTRPEEPATEAKEFGTILHCAILTPTLLKDAYYIRPEPWDGRTTACKEWKKTHSDRPIITREQEDSIADIRHTAMSMPVAGDIIRTGQKEVSFFRRDEETGLLLKCRVDAIATDIEGMTHICDLKKVRRGYATADRFGVQCAELGYDIQCASYLFITGASDFIFVAMEDEPPYEAETWRLSADDLMNGLTKWRRMLNNYAAALADGTWPGYSREVKKLTLPPWAKLKDRKEAEAIYE